MRSPACELWAGIRRRSLPARPLAGEMLPDTRIATLKVLAVPRTIGLPRMCKSDVCGAWLSSRQQSPSCRCVCMRVCMCLYIGSRHTVPRHALTDVQLQPPQPPARYMPASCTSQTSGIAHSSSCKQHAVWFSSAPTIVMLHLGQVLGDIQHAQSSLVLT